MPAMTRRATTTTGTTTAIAVFPPVDRPPLDLPVVTPFAEAGSVEEVDTDVVGGAAVD